MLPQGGGRMKSNNFKFKVRTLESLKPSPSGQTDYYDTDSKLGIRISYGGTKTFFIRYRNQKGKVARQSLGNFPFVSLADARGKLYETLSKLGKGEDPKPEKEKTTTNTVEGLFEYYLKEKKLRPSTRKTDLRRSKTRIYPEIGQLHPDDVDRDDIFRLIESIDAPVEANRTFEFIRRVWNFGAERRKVKHNPCFGLKPLHDEESRERYLSILEIKTVWTKGLAGETSTIRAIYDLALLLGMRMNEILSMEESWIDSNERSLTIPKHQSKTKTTLTLPLPKYGMKIIDNQRSLSLGSPFLFPSPTAKHRTTIDKPQIQIRKKAGLQEHWTFHDLRRTCRTHLARLGIQEHIADRIVGHTEGGPKSRKTYQRWDFWDERREALEKWSSEIDKIVG